MKERKIVPCALLEARRDGAKALQAVKKHFDAIAPRVSDPIETGLDPTRRVRMDDGLDAEIVKLTTNCIGVIPSIGNQRFASGVLRDDGFRDGGLVPLALRELDVERPTFAVDERVDFGAEPTPRVTQSIADDPPLPPAASWWARTTEASRMTASSSS